MEHSNLNAKEVIEKDKRYIIHSWGQNPIVLVEGKGSIVKDINGREYLDCISQMAGPTTIGNSHPRVVEAIKQQVDKIFFTSVSSINIPRTELAERLTKIMPPKFTRFHFASGGAEAIEFALKAAMKITGKKEIISLYNAFHGCSIGCMSLGHACLRQGYPIVPGFRQIPSPYCYRCSYGKKFPQCDFECAKALENAINYASSNDVAAFIMEPIQGMGGNILPPDKKYFEIIREICDRYGILFIVDEIQTGFGRTGKMWATDYFDIDPHIIVIGKALGGGVPLSAAAFREDLITPNLDTEFWHVSTFSGNPLSCAAASAVVDVVIEEKISEKTAAMGRFMTNRLKDMQKEHRLIGEVRGPGLFIGVELVKDRKTKEKALNETIKIIGEAQKRGVLFGLSCMPGIGNIIRILPPMVITREQASKALDILDEILSEVEKNFS